jgi:hypothetical protein
MAYLVRHAHAGDKHHWVGPDHDRPLSVAGQDEARGLLTRLGGYPISRILSRSRGCLQKRGHRSPVGNVTVGGEGGHPSGTGSTLGGTRRWMIATTQARASQNATQARRRSMRQRSLPNLFNQACERSTTHRRASLDRGGTRVAIWPAIP